jgi:hypothetical protein
MQAQVEIFSLFAFTMVDTLLVLIATGHMWMGL